MQHIALTHVANMPSNIESQTYPAPLIQA